MLEVGFDSWLLGGGGDLVGANGMMGESHICTVRLKIILVIGSHGFYLPKLMSDVLWQQLQKVRKLR